MLFFHTPYTKFLNILPSLCSGRLNFLKKIFFRLLSLWLQFWLGLSLSQFHLYLLAPFPSYRFLKHFQPSSLALSYMPLGLLESSYLALECHTGRLLHMDSPMESTHMLSYQDCGMSIPSSIPFLIISDFV